MSVSDNLEKAAKTFAERNELYGDAYKKQGEVFKALFPDGINIRDDGHFNINDLTRIHKFNRLGILNMIISKLIRYCSNFNKGGHADSIHDLGVYAFMLEELDQEKDDGNEIR